MRKLTRGKWIGFLSFCVLLAMVALAFLAPFVVPHAPDAASLLDRLRPPGSDGFPLGTDALGRDVLSRLLYGARASISIALITVLSAAVIGTVLQIWL